MMMGGKGGSQRIMTYMTIAVVATMTATATAITIAVAFWPSATGHTGAIYPQKVTGQTVVPK